MLENVKWSVNNSCNLKCPFCFADYKSKVLTLEEDFRILDKLYEIGVINIDFFGKEPLLDDTIFRIMSYGEERGYSRFNYSFITNGVNLEKYKDAIISSPCRDFTVSYDFRNVRKFNVPICLIEKFPDDIHIEFTIDVHKDGYKDLAFKVMELDSQWVVDSFYFNPIMPLKGDSFDAITEDEYEEFIGMLPEDLLDISMVKIPFEFSRLTKKYADNPHFFTHPQCTAGTNHFFIDSDGLVYGCNMSCMTGNKKQSCDFLTSDLDTIVNTIKTCGRRECV